MNREQFFQELRTALHREGFTPQPEQDELLPVEWDGLPLCRITADGGVRYWQEDVATPERERACERATDLACTVREYMTLLEHAPPLQAQSLTGDYRERWQHWRERCFRMPNRNLAALFLLTAYGDIWRRMIWKFDASGFDFQSVQLAGIQPELYSVYQAAKAISTGSRNITLADLASPELVTDEAFHLIVCALLLAMLRLQLASSLGSVNSYLPPGAVCFAYKIRERSMKTYRIVFVSCSEIAPDLFVNLCVGQHTAFVGGQQQENPIFFCGKLNLLSIPKDLSSA